MHDKKTIAKLKRDLRDKVNSIHKRLEYVAPKLKKKDISVTDLELGALLQDIGPDFYTDTKSLEAKEKKYIDEAFRTTQELKDEFRI